MNERERATILAALRCWQRRLYDLTDTDSPLISIATNEGAHEPMQPDSIDALCERINTDYSPPVVVVTVRGGLVEEVEAREPMTILTIDHDIDGASDDDLHTLPDGQQVLTSLTAATISDLSDYQPLLAHLTEPTVTATPATPRE